MLDDCMFYFSNVLVKVLLGWDKINKIEKKIVMNCVFCIIF